MAGPIRSARLRVRIDGESVDVPGDIGTDRPRAVQAPAHTHDTTGEIALEGRAVDSITLGQFFTVWGVRLDGSCLGSGCGGVRVRGVDGISLRGDPRGVRLGSARDVVVSTGP